MWAAALTLCASASLKISIEVLNHTGVTILSCSRLSKVGALPAAGQAYKLLT